MATWPDRQSVDDSGLVSAVVRALHSAARPIQTVQIQQLRAKASERLTASSVSPDRLVFGLPL